jgi:ribonucleoside-diphosphate reductase alpha chain
MALELKKYAGELLKEDPNTNSKLTTMEKPNKAKCPECGAELVDESGCICCKSCGFSKC